MYFCLYVFVRWRLAASSYGQRLWQRVWKHGEPCDQDCLVLRFLVPENLLWTFNFASIALSRVSKHYVSKISTSIRSGTGKKISRGRQCLVKNVWKETRSLHADDAFLSMRVAAAKGPWMWWLGIDGWADPSTLSHYQEWLTSKFTTAPAQSAGHNYIQDERKESTKSWHVR